VSGGSGAVGTLVDDYVMDTYREAGKDDTSEVMATLINFVIQVLHAVSPVSCTFGLFFSTFSALSCGISRVVLAPQSPPSK
jgi:hypothetical protein